MSIDNDHIDFNNDEPSLRRKSDYLLVDMYHTIKSLNNKVESLSLSLAEEKLKQAHSQDEINEFKTGMRKVVEKIDDLRLNEAKSSIKFGILTFVATLIFVTIFNAFVNNANAASIDAALPPHKSDLSAWVIKKENETD